MKDMKHIGTMGHLLKKEDLATFESTISFDQLILESQMPFPGYYELFKAPNVRELEHNCLMPVLKTQRQICEDDAIRSIMHVKRKHPDVEFDAVLGHVMLQNEKRTVFRIKIKEIDNLKIILKAFEDEGYVFEKHKKVRPYSSLIEIRKFSNWKKLQKIFIKMRLKLITIIAAWNGNSPGMNLRQSQNL